MLYDVVISGASPSGLTAAKYASKKGLKTLVIEKKKDLSVLEPANTMLYSMLDKTGISIPKSCIVHKTKGTRMYSPSGDYIEMKDPGFSMDRAKFDRLLLEEVYKNGGEVIFGTSVTSVIVKDSKVNGVSVKDNSGKKEILSKVLIGADGFKSELSGQIGLSPMKYPKDVAFGVQADMVDVDIDPDFFEFYLGKKIAPGWKAALSPSGKDSASVAVCVRGCGPCEDYYFDKLVKKSIASHKFIEAKIISKMHGYDTVATIPKEIVSDGFMAVGGSAGQSGLSYGMLAGKIAAEKALVANNLDDFSKVVLSAYEKEWKRRLIGEYKQGRLVLRIFDNMGDDKLNQVFEAASDVDFSGDVAKSMLKVLFKNIKLSFSLIPILVKSLEI